VKQDAISLVMRRLSSYISAAGKRPLPPAVLERTKHHVLDTIAAMVSGSRLLPGRKGISYVKTLGGAKEACVIGSRIVTNAANAALANGMCAHADETDDSHAPSVMHPGCGIVPAALAVAEKEGRNGEALLRAVALGYDVATRLTMSLNAFKFREDGLSTHSYGPTFGAAAAAGSLLRLNERQARYLLSYAAQQASGISCWMRDAEHIEKAFDFGGMPARNGVTAATMVAQGFTGVDDVFAGERNFFVAHGRPANPEEMVRGLGADYEILRTNIKRWSVGSPIQAPLDSLLELIKSDAVKAEQVEKLTIRVAHRDKNTTDDRPMPDINMQHMCAVMLMDGTVTFKSSHDEKRFRDPKVVEFRKKIDLQGDDALTKTMPARQAIVELALRDGRTLRHHTVAVRGTAENPMSRAEVDAKSYDLIAPIAGKARARRLCDAVWHLESLKDVRKLRPLLQEKP
jgi:2-methylcitrate dehydratase PrpD